MYEDMINLRSGTCGQCHLVANVKSVASKFGVCFKNINFFSEECIIHFDNTSLMIKVINIMILLICIESLKHFALTLKHKIMKT